jgi:hypothetical protein
MARYRIFKNSERKQIKLIKVFQNDGHSNNKNVSKRRTFKSAYITPRYRICKNFERKQMKLIKMFQNGGHSNQRISHRGIEFVRILRENK